MDIPGNLGASSVPPLPSREVGALGKTKGEGSSNKEMVLTAPRQQTNVLPTLPPSIQSSSSAPAIGGLQFNTSMPTYSGMGLPSYGAGSYAMPGRTQFSGMNSRYPYYNSYGGGYGGYNSGYNNFMTEITNLPAVQSLQSVVNTFGSVSVMLESCYNAVLASVQAMVGVADQFSKVKVYFTQLFGALATLRLVKHLLKRIPLLKLNSDNGAASLDPDSIWGDDGGLSATGEGGKPRRSMFNLPLLLYIGHLMAAPYIIWKLINHSQQKQLTAAPNPNSSSGGWESGQGEHFIAKAAYPFTASQESELSLTAGQLLVVAPQSLQKYQQSGWLLAAKDGKTGLVPANYVKIINKRNG